MKFTEVPNYPTVKMLAGGEYGPGRPVVAACSPAVGGVTPAFHILPPQKSVSSEVTVVPSEETFVPCEGKNVTWEETNVPSEGMILSAVSVPARAGSPGGTGGENAIYPHETA